MPLVCSHSHHPLFICNLALPSPSPSYAFTPIVLSRPRSAPRLFLNPLRAPPRTPLSPPTQGRGPPAAGGPGYPLPSCLTQPGRGQAKPDVSQMLQIIRKTTAQERLL